MMKYLALIFCCLWQSFCFLSPVEAQIPSSQDILSSGGQIDMADDQGADGKLQDMLGEGDNGGQITRNLFERVSRFVRQFTIPIGIIVLIIAGIQLITARGNADELAQKMRQLLYIFVGFMLIMLTPTLVDEVFFGTQGEIFFGTENSSIPFAGMLNDQLFGIVDFVTTFAVAILLLLVVASVIQLVLGSETDESRDTFKKRILYGAIGVLVMSIANRLVFYFFRLVPGAGTGGGAFGRPDANLLVIETVRWINFILGYVAILAVISIIVGGLYMLFYFGDDDRINKGKSIVISSVIGLIIAFCAWTIIQYFLFPYLNS